MLEWDALVSDLDITPDAVPEASGDGNLEIDLNVG